MSPRPGPGFAATGSPLVLIHKSGTSGPAGAIGAWIPQRRPVAQHRPIHDGRVADPDAAS
jgi:hypothetical protein